MRIGVFGGSFDPPHSAHLQVALAARGQLKLDRVIWVPAFHPPHKNIPATDFKHRSGMAQALIAGAPAHEVSDIESLLPQPSYTLHTLRALKSQQAPGHSWHLIIGADNWDIFPAWHQPAAVLAEAALAVYPRQGIALTHLPHDVTLLDCPEIPLTSTHYREQLQIHPEKALAELPRAVADYIRFHGLYGLSAGMNP